MARAKKTAAPATSSASARVYSYLRFSNEKQAAGASIDRQLDYAIRWAKEHGMTLDQSLTMKDEGYSAYHQKHIEKGKFGVFLEAIRQGDVPPGSVLIVESLDRLSRADPIIAQHQLNSIVIAGIEVVTASDGMRISLESVKKNPGILFMALGVMMRANEESDRKSDRILDAAHRAAKQWIEGTSRKRVAVGRDPGWLVYNAQTNEYELLHEFITPLMAMIGYFRAGASMRTCFDKLLEAGIPLPPPRFNSRGESARHKAGGAINGLGNVSRLYEIIGNRALIGEKEITIGATAFHEEKHYPLLNYYPALMTEAEFEELQQLRKQRGRVVSNASRIVGVINGIGIAKCMRCDAAMGAQNVLTRSRRADGKPNNGHRRFSCTGWAKATNSCRERSMSIVPIERAIMDYCSDQMNLTALFAEKQDATRTLNGQLALARAAVEQTEATSRKLMALIAKAATDDDDDADSMFVSESKRLHALLKRQRQEVTDLEFKIESAHRASHPAMADVWAQLRAGVEQLDPVARTKARKLVIDTFKQIEIKRVTWHGEELIELRLTSKRDVIKGFRIDSKTGEWRGEVVVDDTRNAEIAHRRPARNRRAATAAAA